jgi:hypothetical protein
MNSDPPIRSKPILIFVVMTKLVGLGACSVFSPLSKRIFLVIDVTKHRMISHWMRKASCYPQHRLPHICQAAFGVLATILRPSDRPKFHFKLHPHKKCSNFGQCYRTKT